MEQVKFIRMNDGDRADYHLLEKLEKEYNKTLPDRILDTLKALEFTLSGYRVNRLEHSLQSATRAYQDNRSTEYIVATLVHDIGDELAPYSHSEMAASILRPFVEEKLYWIVKTHGIFQMYYYAHHVGGDRFAREQYKDHRWYQEAIEFCELYDQNCFDPDFQSKPLDFFEPMVREVFSKDPQFV